MAPAAGSRDPSDTRIVVDDTRWPLVVIRAPSVLTPEELRRHFEADVRRFLKRQEPYGAVVDARRVQVRSLGPSHRRAVANIYQECSTGFEKYLVAECYVLASPAVRGVLQAVRWLSPPKWATNTVAEQAEAVEWVRRRLVNHSFRAEQFKI